MPRFRDLELMHGGVIVGLRRTTRAARGVAGARYGLFVAHKDGMGALVDALAARLPDSAVQLGTRVDRLERTAGGWQLRAGAMAIDADAVVLACPAYTSAELLAPIDSLLAATLADITYASSAIVTLAVRTSDLPHGLQGFGFVVPAVERRDLLACTFSSRKWPGRAPEGFELLRAFVGGVRLPEMVDRDDAALVSAVRADLARWIGLGGDPAWTRVDRWRRAMPQYELGHAGRLATIDERMAALPRLALAGNAYRGIGIPDSVHSGEAAVDALLGLE
jgi:oxygen-dependent protoporphyrinogen oxidase